ncbi:hypothetical protein [Candidatus Arthromitus sp. SFB-turkey]|uniref:hypothetical protein n=1 Tax=Candidatus Arthromitus sp. SFB-turkey TaxID=1840217 RepID=UPI0007F4F2E8|nr:hypothetical protein [Candidatus Arthromitus sp. SFB-turkey]OAT87871.1 hypothetical protein A6P36_03335 [Candidatus Arthromitus sp. SFB-turkey]HJD00802.1 hypothetical protein [Candidatus Dwaynia gallinarum]
MKYALGIISLIIGIVSNFLMFTQVGNKIVQTYSINMMYFVVLSVIGLILAVFNLIKNKEKVLNILGIISNVIFVGYSLMLISFVL